MNMMDSGSVTASGSQKNEPSKRQKSSDREGSRQDMISNLPDFIIGHILSLLPTEEARSSYLCVLSKRWIHLWTFITELCIDDRNFNSEKSFESFVYRALHHLDSSSIQSFSFVISGHYEVSLSSHYEISYHINEWMCTVSNRRVKKLSVDSRYQLHLSPHSLFKCRSLEELVLRMYHCIIIVPTFVCLSSLTVLKLSGIAHARMYSSNDSEMRITLNFPVLRKFETKNCTWFVRSATLEVPLLEVVSIDFDPAGSPWSLSSGSQAEVKFCASRLTEFHYSGFLVHETIFLAENVACANFTLSNSANTGNFVCKLLNCNAEDLKLKLVRDPLLLDRAKESFADIPPFGMLRHLELHIVTGEILLGFLSKSPFLKTLVFTKLIDFDEELVYSATVPGCFLSTLQVVKFERIDGDEHELRFAKFVMENAQVLERISFSRGIRLHGTNLEEVKAKLFSFKNGFSIVDFSPDDDTMQTPHDKPRKGNGPNGPVGVGQGRPQRTKKRPRWLADYC